MENIKLSLDKSKKYIVACSFGPDSMALLDAAIKNKLHVAVAHVNYRKREAAKDEMDNLNQYCIEHNIHFHLLDLLNAEAEGNFQDWARKVRYDFFKKVLVEEHADAVLVAHQQDDLIETYLMQKKRKNIAKTPGISAEIELFGVKVLRPLLKYTKRQLQEYDETNGVPFSIDQSNLEDHYERNKIRHSIVEKMGEKEREQILSDITLSGLVKPTIKNRYTSEEFAKLSYEEIVFLCDNFMTKAGEHRDISRGFVNEIKKGFQAKTNLGFDISESVLLEQDYGEVVFINKKHLTPYEFKFEKFLNNEYFEIDFSNGAEDRKIKEGYELLTIKNINKNDKLIIKNYSSSINRLFIDWKMPLYLREVWPGIYDKNGQLLYVPRYRKHFMDNHNSKFKIKTDYFLKF